MTTPETARRGFHVHVAGDLSDATTFLSTAGHFNPFSQLHSSFENANRHSGDLGNITILIGGTGVLNVVSSITFLVGNNSIFGRGVVFHSSYDDGISQPTGNSGGRIGACVVGWVDTLPPPLLCPNLGPGPGPGPGPMPIPSAKKSNKLSFSNKNIMNYYFILLIFLFYLFF